MFNLPFQADDDFVGISLTRTPKTMPTNPEKWMEEAKGFEILGLAFLTLKPTPRLTDQVPDPTQDDITPTDAASLAAILSSLQAYLDSADFLRLEQELDGRGMLDFNAEVLGLQTQPYIVDV